MQRAEFKRSLSLFASTFFEFDGRPAANSLASSFCHVEDGAFGELAGYDAQGEVRYLTLVRL